jgi:hypothetical protein
MSSNPERPVPRKAALWPMFVGYYAFCGTLTFLGVWRLVTAIARSEPFWVVLGLVAIGIGLYMASAAVRSQLRMHRRDRS